MVNSSLITEFVNTLDLRPYSEGLDSPAALAAWLAERGLLAEGARATAPDLAAALRLRESLRDLIGGDQDALAALDGAARDAGLAVRFLDGGVRLVPGRGGVRGALGAIVAEVAAAMTDGVWERLKLCEADDCRWAFLDSTKNRSRHWCDMRSCGNRAKVQAFRARQR